MGTPSIGQMLIVEGIDSKINNGSDVAPAVITRAWSPDLVNVRAFLDGNAEEGTLGITSVELHPDRERYLVARDGKLASLRDAGHAESELRYIAAYWPPRI